MSKEVAMLKAESEGLTKEHDEAVAQRDGYRSQLESSVKKTSAVVKKMAVRQADASSSMDAEEADELLEMLDTVEEAREMCEELGMEIDGDMPMEAVLAALKGHYDHSKSVEEVFNEMDVDDSEYLDEDEVQAAVAMLGFAVNSTNLQVVMSEMDPDGNGEVTLDEFRSWWKANIGDDGGGGGASQQEVIDLKKELEETQSKLRKAEEMEAAAVEDPLAYVNSARGKLRKVARHEDGPGAAVTIDTEEAAELLDLIEDEEEAADLCRESGIGLGPGALSLETMKAALKGHFHKDAMTCEQVFEELDADDSGYLDEDEVEQAIAMLGFFMDDVDVIMSEMDPDGNGEVTLEEFTVWYEVNVDGDSKGAGGGGGSAAAKEIADLRKQLEDAAASPRGGGGGGGADVKKLRAEASAAQEEAGEARDSLAVVQQELAQLRTELKAAESASGKQGAGDGSSGGGGGDGPTGMMMKVQEVSFQWKNPDLPFKNPNLLSGILISY